MLKSGTRSTLWQVWFGISLGVLRVSLWMLWYVQARKQCPLKLVSVKKSGCRTCKLPVNVNIYYIKLGKNKNKVKLPGRIFLTRSYSPNYSRSHIWTEHPSRHLCPASDHRFRMLACSRIDWGFLFFLFFFSWSPSPTQLLRSALMVLSRHKWLVLRTRLWCPGVVSSSLVLNLKLANSKNCSFYFLDFFLFKICLFFLELLL